MAVKQMEWNKLLSGQRLGREKYREDAYRASFQRDFDRIIFSSAFRRLQDKTQVFPLAESDYVRTRLTHSLEVACVGRSLGAIVGGKITEKYDLEVHPSDIGAIVAAACLAHDIGNPPLGHSGEEAIRQWFSDSKLGRKIIRELSQSQKGDFKEFEGNAQGFRVLARLQSPDNVGGMQLTHATLAGYMKYPRESFIETSANHYEGASIKKWGFFQQDKELFSIVASAVELIRRHKKYAWWCRHPLAFLVEAADDITYRIIDFEDGYRLGHIGFNEVSDLLRQLTGAGDIDKRLKAISGEKEKIEYLRARAIGSLLEDVAACFMDSESDILSGCFDKALISQVESKNVLKEIIRISKEKAYSSRKVVEIESAGYEVLGGLLETFVNAAQDIALKGEKRASPRSETLLKLIPDQFLGMHRRPDKNLYDRTIKLTDFVSGMTDSYAVSLYKKISGISLPSA
jgi:dGTPase